MSETDHTPIFEAPDLEEVADLFPSYDIHSLIACGGMGAVYQATQRALDRSVAIKILPREFSTDEAFRTGFEAEAKAMAKLNHPNLIGVYDFGEAGGMLYIVMEFVAGNSLYQASGGQAVEQSETVRIVADVCRGLANAHDHGILHRDIKPANILLDMQANPKIGDFGLARASEKQIEEGEQIFGTPGYTAPEVVEPPFVIDHRADIFSVGVMLHELLTGKLPDADPRPASHISGCNPRLDAVIQKAMNPDPAKRYNSALEMAEEMVAIQKSPAKALMTTASAAAMGKKYVPPKLAKKSSSGLGFTLFLLALAAGAAYYMMYVKKPETVVDIVDEKQQTPRVIDITPESPDEASSLVPEGTPDKEGDDSLGNLPEQNAEKLPDPVEDVPEAKFDVETFIDTKEEQMAEHVQPIVEGYLADMSVNSDAFTDRAREEVDESANESKVEALNTVLTKMNKKAKARGYKINDIIPKPLSRVPGMTEIHQEYFEKQSARSTEFIDEISKEKGTYIFGLENEIKRLTTANDLGAIKLLQDEVKLVNEDDNYFIEKFVTRVEPESDEEEDGE
ncbi:MAG: serine/threonine protein kinase [Luteolibacter sp.]